MSDLDAFDRKILSVLQRNGRLTNHEISDAVGLSPSQCSRRRARLEEDGYIVGYSARLNPEKCGTGLLAFVSISLASHDAANASKLRSLLNRLDAVQDAYALTGDMDYLIRIATHSLDGLSEVINHHLLPHEAVQNVKTAIVLERVKENGLLPIER